MFFDNNLIFLNVLEQFAIYATIFDTWFEDLINNVSKLYFNFNKILLNNNIEMFFDNIIIFLNVLEQFAIRATIFDTWFEDLINNVSKLYFNFNDEFISNIFTKSSAIETINPRIIIKETVIDINKQIINDDLFNKLEFVPKTNIRFIY